MGFACNETTQQDFWITNCCFYGNGKQIEGNGQFQIKGVRPFPPLIGGSYWLKHVFSGGQVSQTFQFGPSYFCFVVMFI